MSRLKFPVERVSTYIECCFNCHPLQVFLVNATKQSLSPCASLVLTTIRADLIMITVFLQTANDGTSESASSDRRHWSGTLLFLDSLLICYCHHLLSIICSAKKIDRTTIGLTWRRTSRNQLRSRGMNVKHHTEVENKLVTKGHFVSNRPLFSQNNEYDLLLKIA